LTPAFAFAIVEFTMARNTKNQNSPYSVRAIPSQEADPALLNPEKPAGPNATSAA
jgi:hypothetical protein